MFDQINTIEDAQKKRYGGWAGMPNGRAYNPKHCAEEIMESGRGGLFYQCRHKNGKGIGGLYCGIHAKRHPASLTRHP